MAFVAMYTVQQSADSTSLIITDTSSYASEAKNTFTSRRLYLYNVDGTTVRFPSNSVTDYINFAFATYTTDQITITGFTKDSSLRIVLQLISSAPVVGSVYTSESVVSMVGYTNAAIYNAAQIAATNPARINDQVFFDSLRQLQREKVTAQNAGTYGDQFSAQAALDRAYDIILETNIRF
jgi:hypothetical protein